MKLMLFSATIVAQKLSHKNCLIISLASIPIPENLFVFDKFVITNSKLPQTTRTNNM